MSASSPQAMTFLDALYGDAPASALIEMRWRAGAGMRRRFFGVGARCYVAGAICDLATTTDVYVGVLPRRRPGGGRADLAPVGHVLWADCDTAAATAALQSFEPEPSVVVASGSPDHCHSYWLLSEPVSIADVEEANRRVALRLGADVGCSDAARILRAAPSFNHKRPTRSPVVVVRCDTTRRWDLSDIVDALPPAVIGGAGGTHSSTRTAPTANDPLRTVPPPVYVERLLGVRVPRHGKVHCPFHADRTPSLHVYAEPDRGWYCYGCGRGGSIYDLAAAVRGITTRGADFALLRRDLATMF
jgi:hypothetical protein